MRGGLAHGFHVPFKDSLLSDRMKSVENDILGLETASENVPDNAIVIETN